MLKEIFNLESEDDIKVRFGGTNHFFWITDLKIRGKDGYQMLADKLSGREFSSIVKVVTDDLGYESNVLVCSELFGTYGFLPYVADRHISEFLSPYLTGSGDNIKKYKLNRTTISDRRKLRADNYAKLSLYLKGEEEFIKPVSREAAASILNAFLTGEDFIDVVNLPNEGQISNLPLSSIVETLGVVRESGFVPMTMGPLPKEILNLVLPHVVNQDMIVTAGLTGDIHLALSALYNDPLCAHLTRTEINEMGMKLLRAHRQYLPQFADVL